MSPYELQNHQIFCCLMDSPTFTSSYTECIKEKWVNYAKGHHAVTLYEILQSNDTNIYICAGLHTCVYIHIYIHIRVYTSYARACVHSYAQTHICTRTYIYQDNYISKLYIMQELAYIVRDSRFPMFHMTYEYWHTYIVVKRIYTDKCCVMVE